MDILFTNCNLSIDRIVSKSLALFSIIVSKYGGYVIIKVMDIAILYISPINLADFCISIQYIYIYVCGFYQYIKNYVVWKISDIV